ncbi:ubiquitin-like with PHD and RING finger domains 2 [Rhizophlyctis rosea]|uniref:RING-type E3 ubiquitin transferase n=1 Tax=Rhizophlyctis rosea TaxID=64517 RepID=A0AAD5SEK7_9FUNG|nr:ubiquitin-like with PHD and RING finger domains 2 [Rhizophlyctis rosea]
MNSDQAIPKRQKLKVSHHKRETREQATEKDAKRKPGCASRPRHHKLLSDTQKSTPADPSSTNDHPYSSPNGPTCPPSSLSKSTPTLPFSIPKSPPPTSSVTPATHPPPPSSPLTNTTTQTPKEKAQKVFAAIEQRFAVEPKLGSRGGRGGDRDGQGGGHPESRTGGLDVLGSSGLGSNGMGTGMGMGMGMADDEDIDLNLDLDLGVVFPPTSAPSLPDVTTAAAAMPWVLGDATEKGVGDGLQTMQSRGRSRSRSRSCERDGNVGGPVRNRRMRERLGVSTYFGSRVREVGSGGMEEEGQDPLSKGLEDDENEYSCPLCLELVVLPVTTSCKHHMCQLCMKNLVKHGGTSCPQCRQNLVESDMIINHNLQTFLRETFPHAYNKRTQQVLEEAENPQSDVTKTLKLHLQFDGEKPDRTWTLLFTLGTPAKDNKYIQQIDLHLSSFGNKIITKTQHSAPYHFTCDQPEINLIEVLISLKRKWKISGVDGRDISLDEHTICTSLSCGYYDEDVMEMVRIAFEKPLQPDIRAFVDKQRKERARQRVEAREVVAKDLARELEVLERDQQEIETLQKQQSEWHQAGEVQDYERLQREREELIRRHVQVDEGIKRLEREREEHERRHAEEDANTLWSERWRIDGSIDNEEFENISDEEDEAVVANRTSSVMPNQQAPSDDEDDAFEDVPALSENPIADQSFASAPNGREVDSASAATASAPAGAITRDIPAPPATTQEDVQMGNANQNGSSGSVIDLRRESPDWDSLRSLAEYTSESEEEDEDAGKDKVPPPIPWTAKLPPPPTLPLHPQTQSAAMKAKEERDSLVKLIRGRPIPMVVREDYFRKSVEERKRGTVGSLRVAPTGRVGEFLEGLMATREGGRR